MKLLGTVLLFISAAAFVAFPVTYHFTSSGLWRYSPVGRALMAFMGVLAGVMVLAVWSVLFGPLPQFSRVIVWGAIAFVAWRQVWLLVKVRRNRES